MAIKTILGKTTPGVPTAQVSTAGISDITQASAEASAGTIVRAKDSKGDIVGVLLGKKTISMSVSGYSTVQDGSKLGEVIKVGGVDGIVISSGVDATTEDFTKYTAQGRAIQGVIP